MKGIKVVVLAAFMSSPAFACLYCPPPAPAPAQAHASVFVDRLIPPSCQDGSASTMGEPVGLGSGDGGTKPPGK